jgi:hypothetical protein
MIKYHVTASGGNRSRSGHWFWEPGAGMVHFDFGPWTQFEQSQLEPAALELHTMGIGLHSMAAWMRQWWPEPAPNPNGVGPFIWFDAIQVADNQSAAEHIGNTAKASKPAERFLARFRTWALQSLQIRVQSHTAVREVVAVQAADHLSKGKIGDFHSCMRELFGPSIKISRLDPPSLESRSLTNTIKFMRSVDTG